MRRTTGAQGVDRADRLRQWTALARRGAWGQVAEWLKAADCKSARVSRTLVRIQPCPPPPQRRFSLQMTITPPAGSGRLGRQQATRGGAGYVVDVAIARGGDEGAGFGRC